jgi:hypothetical protein
MVEGPLLRHEETSEQGVHLLLVPEPELEQARSRLVPESALPGLVDDGIAEELNAIDEFLDYRLLEALEPARDVPEVEIRHADSTPALQNQRGSLLSGTPL